MASPSKRLKLTPQRQQGSQESKITSTPQRDDPVQIGSPNISRISSLISNRSVRTRLSDIFESNTKENLSSSDYEDEVPRSTTTSYSHTYKSGTEISVNLGDYESYLNDFGRIKHVGNVWKIYKPVHDGTLYAQLVQEPQCGQEVVTELLLLYNRKPEVAVCNLLKLCVDLCGYQNFDISKHFNLRDNTANDIIKLMESDEAIENEVIVKSGKYLFMESKTQLAKILKIGIYNFLQKLIVSGHERGILYDEFIAKHFFVFIKAMAFSDIRAIHHTGVVIGVKVLSAIVMVYDKVINDEISSSEEGIAPSRTTQEQKQDLNTFLEYFYFIFIKNCRIQDNKLTLMRVECIHELSLWIGYLPKVFITQLQGISCLCKLMIDVSKEVRYAALETFEALIRDQNTLTILKSFMPDFAEAVGKRFYDVDNKVTIKAIDIFTTFLRLDESLITTHRFKCLINLVFDKTFVIGEAAARFITCYLRMNEDNEYMILIQLAKFSMKPGHAVKPLLVEGFLHNCETIQNWEMFINILENDAVDIEIRQALVEVFSESVYQTLEGHSTVMREMSPKVTRVDVAEYTKIAQYFGRLNALLKKYKDHSTILIEFLKIISLVSKDILNENYCQHYMEICHTMELLFHYHSEEELLTQLAKNFRHFCNITHFANRANNAMKTMCSKYSKEMLNHPEDDDYPIIVRKVNVLFAYFNLTTHFTWESLFDCWSDSDIQLTNNLVSCCKWYLIWSLKSLTDRTYPLKSEIRDQFALLTRICKEYISTCFNLLQNLDGQQLHFTVYESLTHLHISYMKDLEKPIKMFKQFEELKLVINDQQLQLLLVSFLDKYVICNITLPLQDQRKFVVDYINLVHYNVLPTQCLGYVFKYYYAYYKQFGPIIESSLESLAASTDENVLLMMIVYTLTLVYDNILSKHGVVDIRTEEARHMKLLLKQLLTFKMFRSPNSRFKKLLYFTFNYAFQDETKYSLLYFVKYFIDLLMEDDRQEVLDFFKKKMPKDAEKNDAVLYVATYMKNFKPSVARRPKQVPKENKNPVSTSKRTEKTRRTKKTEKTVKPRVKPNTKTNVKRTPNDTRKTQNKLRCDSETSVSDDLTIHDSESDDLEEGLSRITINQTK